MLKIKSLFLKNYAGFNGEYNFNFLKDDGSFNNINMFFGPNGCGKSTSLNAIAVLSRANSYKKRDKDQDNLLLRKMQFHTDYDPSYSSFSKYNDKMEIKGVFSDGQKDLTVHIANDDVIQNDLLNRNSDNCVFVDADNPINISKFQVPAERIDLFLRLAKAIYGYDCYVEKAVASNGVESSNSSLKNAFKAYANNIDKKDTIEKDNTLMTKNEVYSAITDGNLDDKFAFYQDFVIKKGDVNVHYKAMSAGEKKIATLLRCLCDPSFIDKSDIVLIDNLELHVYFKRHKNMIDKLIEEFSEKQFIVTSHSGIMIDHVKDRFGEKCLFDISVIKGQIIKD